MGAAPSLLTLRVPNFDAAVRTAVEPRLAGRPVVVVTSMKPLGRVLAASPAAREAGVVADMPYPVARARCPDASFFAPDKELAGRAIRAMVATAGEYSPLVEPVGDGRILLDTRGTEKLWGVGLDVAEKLRADIRRELRLPVAAGLASCRPWSLLASRAAGDDGAWWVAPGQEDMFLNLVSTAWIDGIGLRTRERLAELKINRVGQLRQFSRTALARQFGARDAKALWTVIAPDAWDEMPVACIRRGDGESDAVRAAAVIPEATVSAERLRIVARTLAAQASADLRRRGMGALWVRLSLLYADGATNTARSRTDGYIQDAGELSALAETLLARVFTRRVSASRLWFDAEGLGEPLRQGVLFPDRDGAAKNERPAGRLHGAVDRIRARYGDASIKPGVLVEGSKLGRASRSSSRARQVRTGDLRR